MDNREYGLWTLPRLWKTREARAARVACRLGEVVSCLPTQPRRFPQSLGKRSRVSHERPQAPPEIDTRRICFIGIRKRNRLVEAMENALPGFEESLVVKQRLEPSQPSGAFSHSLASRLSDLRRSHPRENPLKRPKMLRSLPTSVLDKRRLSATRRSLLRGGARPDFPTPVRVKQILFYHGVVFREHGWTILGERRSMMRLTKAHVSGTLVTSERDRWS